MNKDLTQGSVIRSMLRFAVPMILGNLLQQCYNIADTLIVSWYLGPDALAAVGSSFTLMTFLTSILLGMCSGTKYLLCDETFDGLDPVVRQAVKSLIASEMMNRDFTPVISSHNLRELEDICDAIGLLHQGRLLLARDLDQLRCSICKLQCVIPDPHREQALIRSLRILKMERTGSLLTLTVRGGREETVRLVQAQDPLFFEVLPLTLEEIFISETEVAGYDIKDFLH